MALFFKLQWSNILRDRYFSDRKESSKFVEWFSISEVQTGKLGRGKRIPSGQKGSGTIYFFLPNRWKKRESKIFVQRGQSPCPPTPHHSVFTSLHSSVEEISRYILRKPRTSELIAFFPENSLEVYKLYNEVLHPYIQQGQYLICGDCEKLLKEGV